MSPMGAKSAEYTLGQIYDKLAGAFNSLGGAINVVLSTGSNVIGKVDTAVSTPVTYNVTLTTANTEYSQALPANCRHFQWQCRTAADVRYAYVTGKVATPTAPYNTLKANYTYASPTIAQGAAPSTLYLASTTAGVVVCIEAWT